MMVMVDIDNTLWNFEAELITRLRKALPDRKILDRAPTWEYPLEQFTDPNKGLAIFKGMHVEQERFEPYEGAQDLLVSLRDNGYFIYIASNRPEETTPELVAWLEKHQLPHDAVFCGEDKRNLFYSPSNNFQLVIDDSPYIHTAAADHGIPVLSLSFLYNQGNPHVEYFDNLIQMAGHIKEETQAKLAI